MVGSRRGTPRQQSRTELFIIVLGMLLTSMAFIHPIFPPITYIKTTPLAVIDSTFVHMFTTVTTYSDNYFTEITADISTSKIISSPVSRTVVSWWIAIYAKNSAKKQEFIQIGIATSYPINLLPDLKRWGDKSGTYAFWASAGPVESTDCEPEYISSLSYGSINKYSIKYYNGAWNLFLNGKLIKSISFPYKASGVQFAQEINTFVPEEGGFVNAGVVSFTNIKIGYRGATYNLRDLPTALRAAKETRFKTNNGYHINTEVNLIHLGWNQPNTIYSPPTPAPAPTPTPTPTPSADVTPYAITTTYSIPSELILGPILTVVGVIMSKRKKLI